MSGPISFDPVPVPARTALANLPPSAQAQATTLDANFAKVNTYLTAKPMMSLPAFSRNTSPWSAALGTVAGGQWVDWPGNLWAPFSFTMPDCEGLFIYVGMETHVSDSGNISCGGTFTGPGVVGPGQKGYLTLRNRSYITCGRSDWLPRSSFVVGQTVTVTPQVFLWGTFAFYADLGEIGVVGMG